MDEDAMTTYLKCDVELNMPGPSTAVVNGWVAEVLRRLADQIEKDTFEDGHHEVKDKVGRPVGSIYIDYSAGDEL